MTTRRVVIRGIAQAGIAGAFGTSLVTRGWSQSGPMKPITIAIGGYTFAYLPLLVATAAGFMKAEGLEVSLVDTGSEFTWISVIWTRACLWRTRACGWRFGTRTSSGIQCACQCSVGAID